MKINGQKITAEQFAYDGCHKIYLINTAKDKKELTGLGYKLFPIKELEETFKKSCSLRFISNADLQGEHIVDWFEVAKFS